MNIEIFETAITDGIASGLIAELDAELQRRYPGEPIHGVDAGGFRAPRSRRHGNTGGPLRLHPEDKRPELASRLFPAFGDLSDKNECVFWKYGFLAPPRL